MRIFTIRDNSAEAFNRPFTSLTKATAMREIALGLEKDSPMDAFASDFSLYQIGEFDPTTGRITAADPSRICDISELKEAIPDADTSPRQ